MTHSTSSLTRIGAISGIVNTIADLRTLIGDQDNEAVIVLGRLAVGDGAGGVFYWSATSVGTDDGGTVIGSNRRGRWLVALQTSTDPKTSTTYTIAAGDNGHFVTLTNGSAITVTLPSGLPPAFNVVLIQGGAGQITVSPGAGVTMNNRNSFTKTAAQYAAISLISIATESYVLAGDGA